MDLIADKNGVDVIIPPVTGLDGFQVNLDFNFPKIELHKQDNLCREWDLKLLDGKHHIGNARFTAYQFIADGVIRRTVTLHFVSLEPRHRGQKKSYDLAKYVLQTVETECDRDWGEAYGKPVLFIEKKDFAHLPEKERNGFFDFLKKLGEKILGFDSRPQPSGGELSVSVIGDQLSMQLIEGHLIRSNSLDASNRHPGNDC
jgi:hypothetical protein